jgi:hypothetical protein
LVELHLQHYPAEWVEDMLDILRDHASIPDMRTNSRMDALSFQELGVWQVKDAPRAAFLLDGPASNPNHHYHKWRHDDGKAELAELGLEGLCGRAVGAWCDTLGGARKRLE